MIFKRGKYKVFLFFIFKIIIRKKIKVDTIFFILFIKCQHTVFISRMMVGKKKYAGKITLLQNDTVR